MKSTTLLLLASFSLFSSFALAKSTAECELSLDYQKGHEFEIKLDQINVVTSNITGRTYRTRVIHNQNFTQVEIVNTKEEVLGFVRIDEELKLERGFTLAFKDRNKLLKISCQ